MDFRRSKRVSTQINTAFAKLTLPSCGFVVCALIARLNRQTYPDLDVIFWTHNMIWVIFALSILWMLHHIIERRAHIYRFCVMRTRDAGNDVMNFLITPGLMVMSIFWYVLLARRYQRVIEDFYIDGENRGLPALIFGGDLVVMAVIVTAFRIAAIVRGTRLDHRLR